MIPDLQSHRVAISREPAIRHGPLHCHLTPLPPRYATSHTSLPCDQVCGSKYFWILRDRIMSEDVTWDIRIEMSPEKERDNFGSFFFACLVGVMDAC